MNLVEWLSTFKGEIAMAGAAGSAVSAIMEWEGFLPGVRRIFVGTVTAFFLGPVGVPIFGWAFHKVDIPVEHAASVGGFLMGIGGVVMVEIILRAFRMKKRELEGDDHG